MYSLVSPSVLCMDLVRHDNALGVLDVLDRAITLGPADVASLESAHRDDDARDRAWAEVERLTGEAPKLSDAVAAVRQTIADAGFDTVMESGFADRLSRTPMFGLPHLLSMVRNDVLDWTWERSREVSVCRHPPPLPWSSTLWPPPTSVTGSRSRPTPASAAPGPACTSASRPRCPAR